MLFPEINTDLYKCFIHNTISNELFHTILTALEYVTGIFPLILSSVNQLFYFQQQYTYTFIENYFSLMSKLKFLLICSNNNKFDYLYFLLNIFFPVISIICFYILNYFYSKKEKYNCIDKLIVNFYNVLMFRYFSFYFLDLTIYTAVYLLIEDNQSMLSVICGIICVIWISYVTLFILYFVDNFSLYLNINNKLVCDHKIYYPFGTYVIKYEFSNLLFKIILSLSRNIFEIKKQKITYLVFILNILSLILSISNTVGFIVRYINKTINFFSIKTCEISNTLRKIILMFSFFLQLYTICFKSNLIQNQLIIISVSLITSTFIVIYFINVQFIYKLIKNPKNNLNDIFIYLMSIETPFHPCLNHNNSNNITDHNFIEGDTNEYYNIVNTNYSKNSVGFRNTIVKAITAFVGNRSKNKELSMNLKIKPNQNVINYEMKTSKNWIELFNNLIIKHSKNCCNKNECCICRKLKKKDKHYSLYQIMNWFYKEYYIRKKTSIDQHNAISNNYILKIMYSKIKRDVYKTMKYYIMFLHDCDVNVSYCLNNSMTLLFNAFMESANKQTNIYLISAVEISECNKDLHSLLDKLLSYIKEDIHAKTVESVIDISKEMLNIKNRFYTLYSNFDKKDSSNSNEQHHKTIINKRKDEQIKELRKKNLFSVCKYHFILQRFVIELMLNRTYEKLSHQNIEIMDEYLNYHFSNDKICILEVKLHDTRNNQLKIIKLTGFPTDYNDKLMFYEYFPKQIREQGIDELLNTIETFKKYYQYHKEFEFVIEKDGFIEYFKYNFEIADLLLKESLLIYGNYYNSYENILLLNFSKCHSTVQEQLEQVEICHFSETVGKLLLIKPKFIYAINQSNSFKLSLGHFFREVCTEDSPSSIVAHEIRPYSISCFLDYFYLKLKIEPLLSSLSSCYYTKHNEEKQIFEVYHDHFKEAIAKHLGKGTEKDTEKFKELQKSKQGSKISIKRVYLTKIIDLNNHYVLYKVSVPEEKEIKLNAGLYSTTGDMKTTTFFGKPNENHLLLEQEKCFNKTELKTISRTSSVNQGTSLNLANNVFIEKKKTHGMSFEVGNLVQKERKKIIIIRIIRFILEIIACLLSFICLTVQLLKTKELKIINESFFKFSTFKTEFGNLFSSLLSLLCIKDLDRNNTEPHNCFNPMKHFTQNHHSSRSINGITLFDFLYYENKHKIENVISNYYSLSHILSHNKNEKLISLLDKNISFYILQQINGTIIQQKIQISFDEAMKLYLSSLRIIVEQSEEGHIYPEQPINLVTFRNELLHFENLPQQFFSPIQIEIYVKMINYVHFVSVMNRGEEILRDNFYAARYSNLKLTVVFILLIIIFHCFIININSSQIKITYDLYKKILFSIFVKLETDESKNELIIKIESLIFISQLYDKKPTPLIHNVLSIQKKNFQKHKKPKHKESMTISKNFQNTVILDKNITANLLNTNITTPINNNNNNSNNKSESILYNEKSESSLTYLVTNKSFAMKHFYYTYIYHLFYKNILLSIIYISTVIIEYILLILVFDEVFGFFSYSNTIITYASLLYTDISLLHLKGLLNTSDNEYSKLLKEKANLTSEHSLIDHYLDESLHYYELKMRAAKDNKIKYSTKLIPTSCKEFYEKIEDFVFVNFYEENKIPFNEMIDYLTFICEEEHLLNLNTFHFSFENTFTLMSLLNNKYDTSVLEETLRFLIDSELYHIYINIVFYLRPYLHYAVNSVLTPTILTKFDKYVVMIWLFLIINIIFEVLLFVINRLLIFRNLLQIKDNLILFEGCMY